LSSAAICWTPLSAGAGPLLDYIRDYDLNNYSLGLAVGTAQNPYAGASNSVWAYPYLTSFRHSAFTDDWLLIRGENLGFRYITDNDWELGLVGRIQTLGLGVTDNDELLGLEQREWAVEAGPLIGWRGAPVHVQFRSYWEVPNRHAGSTSEIEFSLPREFRRGHFVPSLRISRMSDDYADYYFGVSADEANASRPEYRAGSAINAWLGFTLGYELTPRWLLKSTVGVEFLDSAISDSPIVERDRLWGGSVGLAYNANLFQPRSYSGADPSRAIEIRMAVFNGNIETQVERDGPDGQRGDELDLEEFLGVADRQTMTQFDVFFRTAFYHRLQLGYFELSRNSPATLQRGVNFGEQSYPSDTAVTTSTELEMWRFGYTYFLMRDAQKELGLTAGVSQARFQLGVTADGEERTENARVDAPLPTLGVHGSVALGSRWQLNADIDVFLLDADRYEGYMAYLSLNLERDLGKHFSAGVGYNYYGMRLSSRDEDLRGLFKTRFFGPKLYLSTRF
jgi:outer membrane protein